MPMLQEDSPTVPFSTSVPGAFGVSRKGDFVSLAILCLQAATDFCLG